jgi:hypothetical protein
LFNAARSRELLLSVPAQRVCSVCLLGVVSGVISGVISLH